MDKRTDLIEKKLKDFIALLNESYNIYAVILYGSYAEGRPDENSDIDLAVFSDDFDKNSYEEMKKLFRLRRKIDPAIEPLPFSRQDYLDHDNADFVSEVIRKGKLIFKEGSMLI